MNSDASRSSTKKPRSPAASQLRSRSAAIVSWKRSPRSDASMKSNDGSSSSETRAIAAEGYPRAHGRRRPPRPHLRERQGRERGRRGDRRLSRGPAAPPRRGDRAARARARLDEHARDRHGVRALDARHLRRARAARRGHARGDRPVPVARLARNRRAEPRARRPQPARPRDRGALGRGAPAAPRRGPAHRLRPDRRTAPVRRDGRRLLPRRPDARRGRRGRVPRHVDARGGAGGRVRPGEPRLRGARARRRRDGRPAQARRRRARMGLPPRFRRALAARTPAAPQQLTAPRVPTNVKRAAILGVVIAALGVPAPGRAALPGRDGRIAFAADWVPTDCGEHACEEDVSGLVTVRPDGTGRRTLGRCGRRSGYCEDHAPAWSPDGRRIAFVHDDALWVMRANGSHRRRLFRGEASTPCWSPDGRHIAFTEGYGYSGWIEIIRPDGSHRRRLTRDNDNSDPSWSVRGLIAYSHGRTFIGPYSIVTRHVDGRLAGRIKDRNGVGDPDFSPDGRFLAFERSGDHGDSIWRARADGSHGRRVVPHGSQPAWSPSGRSIAYSATPKPSPADVEIFIARRDGSHAHQVGPAPRPTGAPRGDYIEPAWQPL